MPRRKYTRQAAGGHSRKWHGARFDEYDYQLIVEAAHHGDVGASDIIRRAAIREARRILRARGLLAGVDARIKERQGRKLTRAASANVRSDRSVSAGS
jgi:uncharacterized protein (DUF1778 family)